MKKWTGRWIGWAGCPDECAPVFEKKVVLTEMPEKAVMRLSGLGFYVLTINGRRVGDEILQPAFSNYEKTIYYNEPDVTDYLTAGENVIHVTLGCGWFNEIYKDAWQFESAAWRKKPCLIAELEADGSIVAASDPSWTCGLSGWTYNTLRCGETYDARVEPVLEHHAAIIYPPAGILKKQQIRPIRVRRVIEPAYIEKRPKNTMYDFGINLAGDVEITVCGEKGARVIIRMVEQILGDHAPNCRNISEHVETKRFQLDEYILKGEGEEKWHGEFSYNGFRYAFLSIQGKAKVISVKARQFHTEMIDAGGIETDNAMVARVHAAVRQSTMTNFHHMPTDCPHREKNGWTGDAHLSCEQAMFNFDMPNLYEKWVDDIVDCQHANGAIPCIAPTSLWGYAWGSGVTWDMVLFEIPWQLYRYTGDKKYLSRWFGAMRLYLDYLESTSDNGISVLGLGDWCTCDYENEIPTEALLTGCAYYVVSLFEKMAAILGEKADAERAASLKAEIRAAFDREFGDKTYENQTFYAMLLRYNMTDDCEAALNRLVEEVEKRDDHLAVGIFGAKYLLDALTEGGRFDLAWRVATQKDYPSWSFMLDRTGGSTLGESWPGGSSFNHHMFSEIGAWYYKALAGFNLDADHPGFEHVRLTPHVPEDIKTFKAWHETPFGRIETAWDEKTLTVTVPEGATADFVYGNTAKTLTAGTWSFDR